MTVENIFNNPNPETLISDVRFRTEKSRFVLAAFGIFLILFPVIAASIESKGDFLLYFAPIVLALIIIVLFISVIFKTAFLMNLIEVNSENYPNINKKINHSKYLLRYDKKIHAYIVPGSELGITILRLFNHRTLLIHAETLKELKSDDDLDFIIMFHVARLKTKSAYISIFTEIINSLERYWFLNFIFYPFERSTVYTADRIAALYVGSKDIAKKSIAIDMVGSELGNKVNTDALISQRYRCNGFFALLVRLYSPYPGYSYRVAELDNFNSPLFSNDYSRNQAFQNMPIQSGQIHSSHISSNPSWSLVSKKYGEIPIAKDFRGDIVIGRDNDSCDFVIPNMNISRQHVSVEAFDGGLLVKDNNSANGSYINKTKIKSKSKHKLYQGDTLGLSNVADFVLKEH